MQSPSPARSRVSVPSGALRAAIAAEGPGAKSCRRGTHRLLAVEATLDRLRPLMPVWGITRLADITGLDRIGIPVAMATRPNARSVSVSQGKGLTLAAAMASALVEAAELHHAEHLLAPVLYASPDEVAEAGLGPVLDGLPRDPGAGGRPSGRFAWSAAEDLLTGQGAWVPHDLVHADLTGAQPPGGGFVVSSNGLAGGNSRTEAAIHALCEAIERDATARWQALDRSARERTRLDPDSIGDADCRMLLDRFEHAGFAVGLWSTTGPTGIPAFHAALLDRRDRQGHPGAGDGCHLSPAVALLRALTEAAQTRLTYIAGARDDLDPEAYRPDLRADRRARHETLLGDRPGLSFAALADRSGETLADDLATILAALAEAGLSAYGIDLGPPEGGLAVLRVVVPGLRLPAEGR
jgi:ribosomal protein S12 methylthiotransferase accessory factor